MSVSKDTTRIAKTGGFLGNIQEWEQQYPELLEKHFVTMTRRWDKEFPPVMETIFPSAQAPYWVFQWNVEIEPGEMTPFVKPNTATPMVTQDVKYEQFFCKQIKEGFTVGSFDLNYGLPKTIETRTRQVHKANLLRIEHSLVQTAIGNSWNGQNNARMSVGTVLNWALPNSTPIGDILTMMTRVFQMAGEEPRNLFLDWTRNLALHNHPTILNQLQYVDKNLLTNGMITMIKGLGINVVRGYYKEAADEIGMIRSAGRGDQREDITPTTKRWLLDDLALETTDTVGYNFYARGEFEGDKRWIDEDTDLIKYKSVRSFCPVVEDYARIGVFQFTANTQLVDLYANQGNPW
jgi:hypothetical protein